MSDASKIAISKAYLDDLKHMLEAASPGPWTSFVEGRDHDSGSSFIRTGADDIELDGASTADQDFIARAPGYPPADRRDRTSTSVSAVPSDGRGINELQYMAASHDTQPD